MDFVALGCCEHMYQHLKDSWLDFDAFGVPEFDVVVFDNCSMRAYRDKIECLVKEHMNLLYFVMESENDMAFLIKTAVIHIHETIEGIAKATIIHQSLASTMERVIFKL